MALGGVVNTDNTENSEKLVNAIKFAMTNGYSVYVPCGKFVIKEPIVIDGTLIVKGENVFNKPDRTDGHLAATILFAPDNDDVTLFTDADAHDVSFEDVNFTCNYTTCTTDITEHLESPYEYFTWAYTYDDVNCLDLPNSKLNIKNVSISGFSGYGLKCANNTTIINLKIIIGKYGFYNCGNDVMYNTCYVSRCEKAFYWDNNGAVVFVYNVWIDLCGYGFYASNRVDGIITGLIDHCLYAGVRANISVNGLAIDCRMGRLGMYYAGTDMIEHAPTTITDEAFEDMSKGVFLAIKRGELLNIKCSSKPRIIPDSGTAQYLLPTLFLFGDLITNSVIESPYDFGKAFYKTIDYRSNIDVISSVDNYTKQRNNALYADNGYLLPYPYYEMSKDSKGVDIKVNDDMSITFNGTATSSVYFSLIREVTPFDVGDELVISDDGQFIDGVQLQIGYISNGSFTRTAFCYTGSNTAGVTITSDYVGNILLLRYSISANTVLNNLTFRPYLSYKDGSTKKIKTNKELTNDFIIDDISNSFYSELASGITLYDAAVFKQGKHIFGDVVIGGISNVANTDNYPLYLQYKPKRTVNSACIVGDSRYASYNNGYMYLAASDGKMTIKYPSGSNTFAKIHLDYICQ
jgi:hypothetical protein